jgi:hypothetical protein
LSEKLRHPVEEIAVGITALLAESRYVGGVPRHRGAELIDGGDQALRGQLLPLARLGRLAVAQHGARKGGRRRRHGEHVHSHEGKG